MKLRSLAALALTLSAGAADAQNLVVNGSFELPAISGSHATFGAGNGITGWTILGGSIDLIHDYWQAADGMQSIDMNGNVPGAIAQMINTNVGNLYTVSFWLAGNPDAPWNKAVSVYWNNVRLGGGPTTFVQGGNTSQSMGWTQVTFTKLAVTSASTQLRLEGRNTGPRGNPVGPMVGAAIDNIAITATPEPSTYMLMGTGLLALAGVARRRRNA